MNLSGLSGRPWGLLEEKVEINPSKGGDKSDRFKFEPNMSPLSVPPKGLFPLNRGSLLYDFEERLAIAEYDGCQNPTQAERIAYQDAFVSVLVTLSYDEGEEDWLSRKVKSATEWLLDQGIAQAK